MFLIPNVKEIKKQRIKTGLSQAAISLKAGLPINSINRIESGKTKKNKSS
ncbi:MAG: hypothetical protein CR995_00190 [Clostridiales bacterium]|nr:MAG: hypothetical protein CR995_00190 [Clostridiales bacterium]